MLKASKYEAGHKIRFLRVVIDDVIAACPASVPLQSERMAGMLSGSFANNSESIGLSLAMSARS